MSIYFTSTISKETSLENQHTVETTFPFINTFMYICDELIMLNAKRIMYICTSYRDGGMLCC